MNIAEKEKGRHELVGGEVMVSIFSLRYFFHFLPLNKTVAGRGGFSL